MAIAFPPKNIIKCFTVLRYHIKRITLLVLLALLAPTAASAGPFSDVPDDHPYAAAISDLKEQNIMRGNPDGTATPDRLLNRAELLTLLYRATNRVPRSVYGDCFDDVKEGWFEDVVCDAVHEGFVEGYPDHTFRAEQFVIRVEFFKMLLNVMGFTVPDLSQEDKLSIDFLGNVTHSAWYAKYLHRIIALKIIPEAFTAENSFDPTLPVTRGEAAEMISRALRTEDLFFEEQLETETEETSEEEEAEVVVPEGVEVVPFPIHRSVLTADRGAASFQFEVTAPSTVLVRATHKAEGSVSCFLYLLGESSFSYEFFVGYTEGSTCFIRAALRSGRYQVEVRTQSIGEEVALDVEPSSGDGQDGFIDAVALRPGFARSGALTPDDYEDLFRFKVLKAETRRVSLSATAAITCSIFPGEDVVDVFGEQGPACGSIFSYQPGTYYVSVKRAPPAGTSQAYTIDLR